MRITGIEEVRSRDGKKLVRLEFFGCNLRCPYCVHITEKDKAEKMSMNEILERIREIFKGERGQVTLGGAEPTIQKGIVELVKSLKEDGHRIALKTDGLKPDVIRDVIEDVDRFVIEIKAPLDDIDANAELIGLSRQKAEVYLEKLKKTLELVREKSFRAWIRVIPDYVNDTTIRAIGRDIKGADDAMLYQFLSNPTYDREFKGYTEPVPPVEEIRKLARVLLEYVPRVEIRSIEGAEVMEEDQRKG
ncbi:MAG TPA: radical SAM protein [Candidatus Syntrophoarchaeum butanivorans]|uniref:Radical SAM protein n=1 Tax=Candidatus Syntropharchaeum butanivorans TaxID=1839936 RepID=A0A7C1B6D3_9EURY|nr:radical SAM protein [Candidatus Syntrophoarchaeum butanivorans]